jgi:hypothetical protein
MKNLKRILVGLPIALIALLCITTVALAVPADVQFLFPFSTADSIILSWVKDPLATTTVIRYDATAYPTAPSGAGSGTSAYSGTGTQCTISGLIAGQTYYFSAWGFDGVYSVNVVHTQCTTFAVARPSGATTPPTSAFPLPTVPASANQTPAIGAFDLRPFTDIIAYSDNATNGGLGMPINNLWETLAIFGIVASGAISYIKMKNFFIAYFVVFILTCFFIGLHLVQGYLAGAEIVIGAGVWAIERFLQ